MDILHELTHKDQGQISVTVSQNFSAVPGISLHEIEAYRTSMQKYARGWVVRDIDDLLKNQGTKNDQWKSDAIFKLFTQVSVLNGHVGALMKPKFGDKPCRWKMIQKVVTKLRDDLMAIWFDVESRRYCRASFNPDYCRINFMKTKIRQYGIGSTQLPPDMMKTSSGKVKIVAENNRRKIDIRKARDTIDDMFNYDASLAYQGMPGKDPRTPCYKVSQKPRLACKWKLAIVKSDHRGNDDPPITLGSEYPLRERCHTGYKDMTATCWDGVELENRNLPGRALCTYKHIPKTRYGDGASPGIVYECNCD